MRSRIFSFAFLSLAILAVANTAHADEPNRWALLIGVDDYAEADDLQYCAADQRGLADKLVSTGWPRDHVLLMESHTQDGKYLPSRQNIEKQLNLLLSLIDKGDVVLFAFSGHGVQLDGKSYLCPFDARLEESETLVPLESVYQRLSQSPASFKLAMIDACRDDPRPGRRRSFSRGGAAQEFAKSLDEPPQGIAMLVSCGPLQQSIEDDEFKQGVFMHFVLDALGGAADTDSNGQISLGELTRHVGERTKVHVARKYNDFQRPELKGELPIEALDFALASVPRNAAPARPTPNMPQPPTPPVTGEPAANSIGMKFVAIPPGEFMMGSPETEPDRGKDELLHRVRITRGFEMSMYEVTVGQFRQFVAATNHRTDSEKDNGAFGWVGGNSPIQQRSHFNWRDWWANQTDNHPVSNVSWYDANAFCNWLSRQEGKRYRLPTEAEWEYACRAGTNSRYPDGDGDEDVKEVANVLDASAQKFHLGNPGAPYASWDDGDALTASVGRHKPNAFGLYDMLGNVEEWCFDVYGENYYAVSPPDDPRGPGSGTVHVMRGGGWRTRPSFCRPAYRHKTKQQGSYDMGMYREPTTGFRVVREL